MLPPVWFDFFLRYLAVPFSGTLLLVLGLSPPYLLKARVSMAETPQAPIVFDHSPADFQNLANTWINEATGIEDEVAKIPINSATIQNFLLPLIHSENKLMSRRRQVKIYAFVSPSKEVRDASNGAEKLFKTFDVESSMRHDIFERVDALHHKRKSLHLDPEILRYLERTHRSFVRQGLALDSATDKEKLKEINRRTADLLTQYSKNLNEQSEGVWFSSDELQGVPEDVLHRFKRGEADSDRAGSYQVSLRVPDLRDILKYSSNAETRKRMFLANENKCLNNVPIFQEVVDLRDKAARLLGYPNHAAYKVEVCSMLNSVQQVQEYNRDLLERLKLSGQKELERMRGFKREEMQKTQSADSLENLDDRIFLWDFSYYERLLQDKFGSVDERELAEYFPVETVLAAMLKIYENIFGLKFVEMSTGPHPEDATDKTSHLTWHPSVLMFSVWNEAEIGGDFLGYLYLDLYSREGKHNHNTHAALTPVSSVIRSWCSLMLSEPT